MRSPSVQQANQLGLVFSRLDWGTALQDAAAVEVTAAMLAL